MTCLKVTGWLAMCRMPLTESVHSQKTSSSWIVFISIAGRRAVIARAMSEVTQILSQIGPGGSTKVSGQLLPLVYHEWRKLAAFRMAQENPGQTLQGTALVHEVYIRLVDSSSPQVWNNRGHFFAAAAEAMRRLLIENARRKRRLKRRGDRERIPLHDVEITLQGPSLDVLALDEALDKLSEKKPEAHAYHWLRQMLLYCKRLPEAEKELRNSLSLRQELSAGTPDGLGKLARVNAYVAIALDGQAKYSEAERFVRESVDIREQLMSRFPNELEHGRRLGLNYRDLASLLAAMGRSNDCQVVLQRRIDLLERLTGDFPGALPYAAYQGMAYCQMGLFYYAIDRPVQAVEYLNLALERFQTLTPERKDLEGLLLNDTGITDAGLKHLQRLNGLRRLMLWHTNITDFGLQHLKEALAGCEISFE